MYPIRKIHNDNNNNNNSSRGKNRKVNYKTTSSTTTTTIPTANSGEQTSVHATAAVLGSQLCLPEYREKAFQYLIEQIENEFVEKNVTAYYGFFLAKSLLIGTGNNNNKEQCLKYIKHYYEPIAKKWGTIWEKSNENASLAHGWSVGIASFLVITNSNNSNNNTIEQDKENNKGEKCDLSQLDEKGEIDCTK